MNLMCSIKKYKLFTLIELIVVIVILGILTAIVIPNISSQKDEATRVAIQGNTRNLQNAVDTFSIKNHGSLPTVNKATLGKPQPLDMSQLNPDFLRNLPKTKGMKYWVDYNGTLWLSMADAPTNVNYSNGELTWNPSSDSEGYNVFAAEKNDTTSSVRRKNITLIKEVQGSKANSIANLPALEENQSYYISAVDKYGLETPPVSGEYTGYQNQRPIANISFKNIGPILDNQPIQWNLDGFIDPDNDKIISHEWKLNDQQVTTSPPTNPLPAGTHTIQLRVKDENGLWSEWVSKEITVDVDMKLKMDIPNFAIDNYPDIYALAIKSLNSSELSLVQSLNVVKPSGVTFKYAEKLNGTYAVIGQLSSNSQYYQYNKNNVNSTSSLKSVMTKDYGLSTGTLNSIQGFQSYSIDQNQGRYFFGLYNYQTYSTNALGNGDFVYQHNGGFRQEANGQYSSTGVRKFTFTQCSSSCRYYYEDYTLQNVTTKSKGTYISKEIATANALPLDGVHTDGYWYSRQSALPMYIVYFYNENKELIGTFNPETKIFTTTEVNLTQLKSSIKVVAPIVKPTGTNYVFSISRDNSSWSTVSQGSLNGLVDIPLSPAANKLFIRIQFTDKNGTFPTMNSLEVR